MHRNIFKKTMDNITLNPPLVLTLGFAILILIGGLTLSLGIVSRNGESTSLIDSIFVAASASCVTGLTPVNTAEHRNTLGHIVIIILIQIGGFGVMTLASIIPLILRRRIGLKSRQILKEQLNVESLSGMIRLFKYVLVFTFIVESIGAVLLSIRLIPMYGIGKGIWFSIFHSISAFCNAGFDIMGDSIYPLRSDPIINITIMLLIIIGGLGFMVTSEIFYKRGVKNISTHSKLVIGITLLLIILGTAGFYILESFEGGVLVGEGFFPSLTESAFQSVSARTAGFYSVDLTKIKDSSALLLILLMFIGGSPGSTAGGIKTTTFGVILLSTIAEIRGDNEPILFRKHISNDTIRKALAIFFISISIVLLVTFILTITDGFPVIDTLYETVSALATVGATKGITPYLSNIAKMLIIICMYLGRIGPMTMAFALGVKSNEKLIRYPESFISVG